MERMVMPAGVGGVENACPLLDSSGRVECLFKNRYRVRCVCKGDRISQNLCSEVVGSSVAGRFTLGLSAGDSPRDTRSMAKSNCMQAKYIQWST